MSRGVVHDRTGHCSQQAVILRWKKTSSLEPVRSVCGWDYRGWQCTILNRIVQQQRFAVFQAFKLHIYCILRGASIAWVVDATFLCSLPGLMAHPRVADPEVRQRQEGRQASEQRPLHQQDVLAGGLLHPGAAESQIGKRARRTAKPTNP